MSIIANEHLRLGAILLRKELITEEELNTTLEEQQSGKYGDKKIGDVLVSKGMLSYEQVCEGIAEQYNINIFRKEMVDSLQADSKIIRIIKPEMARSFNSIVINRTNLGGYLVIMLDPANIRAKVDLTRLLNASVSALNIMVATPEVFEMVFAKVYGGNKKTLEFKNKDVSRDNDSKSTLSIETLLSSALQERASIIHIDSLYDEILIRYRIDNVLYIKETLKRATANNLLAKILGFVENKKTDINSPKSGSFVKSFGKQLYRFEVNYLPIVTTDINSYRLTIKIININKSIQSLDELYMPEYISEVIHQLSSKTNTLFLISGPSYSGKTSTLYSIADSLQVKENATVMLDSTSEYTRTALNLAYPSYLEDAIGDDKYSKELLKQDADIYFIDNIRDNARVNLPINILHDGKSLIASMHGKDAITALLSMLDYGVPKHTLVSHLSGVLSQNVLRKNCPYCTEKYDITNKEKKLLSTIFTNMDYSGKITLSKGIGCNKCNGSGYIGLIPVYELLDLTRFNDVRKLISTGSSDYIDIQDVLEKKGFRFMVQDACDKVIKGITTLDEVYRVLL